MAGGSRVTAAVVAVAGTAQVTAGATATGVVTVIGALGALGLPPTIATAVVVYWVPGNSPPTKQFVVGQVAVMQAPLPEGHRVTT